VCWGTLAPPFPGSEPTPTKAEGKVKTALQLLDILLALAPYLSVVQNSEVVEVVICDGVLDMSDGVVGMRLVPLLAEKDHTISVGVMALSRVLFEFKSTLRRVRSMKVESNYCLVQMISRQSTSCRFSTLSIPFSLKEVVKLSRLSLVLSSFACNSLPTEVTPTRGYSSGAD